MEGQFRLKVLSTVAAATGLLAAVPGAAQAASQCKYKLSAADQVVALNAVANLIGRYSHGMQEHGQDVLPQIFAMKTEGVSWRVPRGPNTIAGMKALFARPAEDPSQYKGALRMHAMLTPVIEIAADGKTAMGIWDSFGPQANSIDAQTSWLWLKYGVDFVKEDGVWKIWHLQVFPIFNTPWNQGIAEHAKAQAAAGKGANAGGPPLPGSEKWVGPKAALWIYDGKTPLRGPRIPTPYCTYSEDISPTQYDDSGAAARPEQ